MGGRFGKYGDAKRKAQNQRPMVSFRALVESFKFGIIIETIY